MDNVKAFADSIEKFGNGIHPGQIVPDELEANPEPIEELEYEPIENDEEAEYLAQQDVLEELYEQFKAPIPEQYIVAYEDNGKQFMGYQTQYAIDLLNTFCGLGNWQVTTTIIKDEMINKSFLVVMEAEILIGDDNCQVIHVKGYGSGFAKNAGNAYKAAKTNSFKNACRYLGIGHDLYLQGFEEATTEDPVTDRIEETVPLSDSEALIAKITSAETKSDLEGMRDEIVKYMPGSKTQELLFKKYNERAIALAT